MGSLRLGSAGRGASPGVARNWRRAAAARCPHHAADECGWRGREQPELGALTEVVPPGEMGQRPTLLVELAPMHM
ncbi:MAG: hypothetical protein ABJC62_03150, partial [Frankiaceae bacterium]